MRLIQLITKSLKKKPYARYILASHGEFAANLAFAAGANPNPYRGTSPTRKRTLLGPYRMPVPRVLGGS